MTVPCFNCNTTTTLEIPFEVVNFACPHCSYVYKNTSDVGLTFYDKFKPYVFEDRFEIGNSAIFDNQEYTVTGILIKTTSGYEWKEYVLINKKGEFMYLSESEGHWIILHEIEFEKKVGNHPLTLDYEYKVFDRYDYSYPKLVAAQGFFDFDIYNKSELIEYILPPLLLSFEKLGANQTAFLGRHISKRDIKKAFNTNLLPRKTGVGMVQPFLFNLRTLALTCCGFALLIIFTHWFMNLDRNEQVVLNTTIPFDQYSTKDFVTPSFELKGSSAPMTISFHSNVDNSWANVQVALINEVTNEEIYANKDIEYYHGYTDGENWTEGDTNGDFNLCGIPSGKYHLAITPSKATEDLQNQSVEIKASWSSPSMRNVWMTFIFMIVFVVAAYYFERNFENKRWGE
ncbi:DUF4178 domain-containing protein [Flavobacterium psychrophilum]|uniref:DUF4178 domain-containing protein n=1 Tax=Flavobacterium psychrophilum TaxID=96345 RepID=UPI00339702AA